MMKIRLGISQRLIGYHFEVSQQKISKIIWRVAGLLDKYFVSLFLGFKHMTREEFQKKHDSEFVRKLYDIPEGKMALFFDGK